MLSKLPKEKKDENTLATDGSEQSEAAVEEVGGRPFPLNTKVRMDSADERTPLITTLEPMDVSLEYYAQADHYALKTAENTTENAAKILREKNSALTVTTIVIEGSSKSVILEEAGKFGADLIVFGSRGYGMLERSLLGSVSQAVALHAKCSVEIVRSPKTQMCESKKN